MPPRKPETIGQLLPVILRQAEQQYSTLQTVQRQWGRLVGGPLAAHTSPVGLQRGRLVVAVQRPGDGFTLSYRRVKLLKQLQTITDGKVQEITIRPGGR